MSTLPTPEEPRARLAERAVVVGAGIGGLVAARVLADFFERVTVVEKDPRGSATAARKGVPQGQHIHVLLAGGAGVLAELFPGLIDRLTDRGGHRYELGSQMCIESAQGGWPLEEQGLHSVSTTRPLLESCLRDAVLERPEIDLRSEARVLCPVWRGARVVGVRLRLSRGTTTELPADLVVDASGLSALSSGWLREAGFAEPEVSSVRMPIRYSTRVFAIPRGWEAPWKAATLRFSAPDHPHGALLVPVEGDRWMVGLSSCSGAAPPSDLDGFLEFARGMGARTIAGALRAAEPIGPARSHAFPASVRRHFERVARYPDGLLTLGDGLCAFNPAYGQGMSSAALQARELHAELRARHAQRGSLGSLGPAFFLRCAEVIDTPWRVSVLPDLAFAHAEGDRPKDLGEFLETLGRLRLRAQSDRALRRRLLEVFQLVRPWKDLSAEESPAAP